MEVGGQSNVPAALPPGKTRYLTEDLVGPRAGSGQGWKISPPTGIRSPDRPARGESLYRLSYHGPSFMFEGTFIFDIVHTNWLFLF